MDTDAIRRKHFADEGYALLPEVLPSALVQNLASYFESQASSGSFKAGDDMVPGALVRYGDPRSEMLLMLLQGEIEKVVERALLPTYSYTRIYQQGDTLEPHTDRPSCEFSATLTIADDGPWPLFLESTDGRSTPRSLVVEPGGLLVYRGQDLRHWRQPLEGRSQIQIFLHWVDAHGPHAHQVYDGREGLNFQIGEV